MTDKFVIRGDLTIQNDSQDFTPQIILKNGINESYIYRNASDSSLTGIDVSSLTINGLSTLTSPAGELLVNGNPIGGGGGQTLKEFVDFSINQSTSYFFDQAFGSQVTIILRNVAFDPSNDKIVIELNPGAAYAVEARGTLIENNGSAVTTTVAPQQGYNVIQLSNSNVSAGDYLTYVININQGFDSSASFVTATYDFVGGGRYTTVTSGSGVLSNFFGSFSGATINTVGTTNNFVQGVAEFWSN